MKNIATEKVKSELMDVLNFVKVSDIKSSMIPDKPGLYCLRIVYIDKLPVHFTRELDIREHNILFIGHAEKNLKEEFLNNELFAKGPGAFSNIIGSVLGFKPVKGSLISKRQNHYYSFSDSDSQKINFWITENLVVNCIVYDHDLSLIEKNLIAKYQPLLNIYHNPIPLKEVIKLHDKNVEYAGN